VLIQCPNKDTVLNFTTFRRWSLALHLQIQNEPIQFDPSDEHNIRQMLNISDTIKNANSKHLKTRMPIPFIF